MIMAGLEFMDDVPFKDVYINGTVRDIEGKKMSKSLGNIIDPLDIIEEYGTDAMRFSLISITAHGQDVFLSKERFEQGRNFANKIWNASRFILMNLEPTLIKTDLCVFFKKEDLDVVNRWALSRFYSTLQQTTKYLENFQFNEAANTLYGFFWHDFCDWYLEIIKQDIKNPHNQVVMYKILEKSLRLLHPFMPFITEEIWQSLGKLSSGSADEHKQANSIMVEPWPHVQEQIIDKKAEGRMATVLEIITAIRNMRQELDVPLQARISVVIAVGSKENRQLLETLSGVIKNLARLDNLSVEEKYKHIKSSVNSVIKDIHITMPLEGIVDVEKEIIKLDERMNKTRAEIAAKEKMLRNKEFVKKAPEEIVEKEKARLTELGEILNRLKVIKDGLQ